MKELFIAMRYNALYYFSRFLAGLAYIFAWLSIVTLNDFLMPISDALEAIAKGFLGWSEDIYEYAVMLTLPHVWGKLSKERENSSQAAD